MKALYYRDHELIKPEDLELLRKVWGNTPFVFVNEHIIDENSGSGLHLATELMLVIQTTERLFNRSEALKQRIAKGLTYSRSHLWTYVEEHLLSDLMEDAIRELEATTDIVVRFNDYPRKEILRLYNLPYESVMVKVREHEKKIGVIPEPPREIEYLEYFDGEDFCDQCSAYQEHHIKVDSVPYSIQWSNEDKRRLYKLFPFLGKVYYVRESGYLQVYLYDYHGSTKGLMAVLCELQDMGVVFTKKID